MTTEDLLINNGFTKRESKKPKIVSITQTSVTYCEVYERIKDNHKEVITLQTVEKIPPQQGGDRPSHKALLDVKTISSPRSIEVCSYWKIPANQKLVSSHKSDELKLVLGLLRNDFVSSVLGIISLEKDLARIDSNLLIELLETGSLLEEIPPSLLEEYLLEAQKYAFFISPTFETSRRGRHSPAIFPLSPFNFLEGCS
ncbi:MAG: hypothetical protein GPJ51_12410 [Candidatus Heimdallarchaeota archaeon]|nr:hypothetical protein [Candidatus Heimdallarchaeota archaeon]